MSTTFSIIIPSFNRAKVLPDAISSILAQQFSDYEIIIVDDGSVDDTEKVVAQFQNSSIKYVKKANGGVCSARNLGVEYANGDYIIFLDSDDAVSGQWLLNFNNSIIKEGKVDIICGGMLLKSGDSEKKIKPSDSGKGAIRWAVVIPGSYAVRKEFLIKCGLYDENIKFGENMELFIRFKAQNPSVSYTNSFDLIYYPSADGGSKNIKNRFNSNIYLLQKHAKWFESKPKNKFVYLNLLVVDGMKLKENKTALKFLLKSIKMKPFYLKNYARLIQIFFNFIKTDS